MWERVGPSEKVTSTWSSCGLLRALGKADDVMVIPLGAGFYLNAASDKWKKHYNMYDLIVKEIPDVLEQADLGLVSRL